MKLTDQQRAELRALADAATPGPWRIGSLESYDGYSGKPYRNVWQGQGEDARTIARAILDQGNEQSDVDADAMFIAAAREAIPALLADLEEVERKAQLPMKYRRMQFNAELQEELAAVRQQLSEAQAWNKLALYRLESVVAYSALQSSCMHKNGIIGVVQEEDDPLFYDAVRTKLLIDRGHTGEAAALQSAIEQAVAPYKRDAERLVERAERLRENLLCVSRNVMRGYTSADTVSMIDHFLAEDAALSAKEKSNG